MCLTTDTEGLEFHCYEEHYADEADDDVSVDADGNLDERVSHPKPTAGRCRKVWVYGSNRDGLTIALWCKEHGQVHRSSGCNGSGVSYVRYVSALESWKAHMAAMRESGSIIGV